MCNLKRATKYLRKLVAEKQADPSLMTEEDFFAKLDHAEKQSGKSFASVDELDTYIRSL